MENLGGGYELRSASHKYSFKSALIKRDISIINGPEKEQGRVYVFEGMLDALSLLTLNKNSNPACDYLIMHSTNSFSKVASYIQSREYQTIHTFLDNDPTGEKTLKRFQDIFANKIIPQNHFYKGYNDVNDYLQGRAGKLPKTDVAPFPG